MIGKTAVFLLHQILATVGVLLTALAMVYTFSPVVRSLDPAFRPSWLLTETHFFPVQIVVGLASGYRIRLQSRTDVGLYVWILPLIILIAGICSSSPPDSIAISAERLGVPVEYLGESTSRLSHFFGTTCDPQKKCLDQMSFTLPFYTAAAYSTGSLLGRRRRVNIAP